MKIKIENSPPVLEITRSFMPLLTNGIFYLLVGVVYLFFSTNRNNIVLYATLYIVPMIIFIAWAYKLFVFNYRIYEGEFEVRFRDKKINSIALSQLKVAYQDFKDSKGTGLGRGNFIFLIGNKKYKIVNVQDKDYEAMLNFFKYQQIPLHKEKI